MFTKLYWSKEFEGNDTFLTIILSYLYLMPVLIILLFYSFSKIIDLKNIKFYKVLLIINFLMVFMPGMIFIMLMFTRITGYSLDS